MALFRRSATDTLDGLAADAAPVADEAPVLVDVAAAAPSMRVHSIGPVLHTGDAGRGDAAPSTGTRLGELLVRDGRITSEELSDALLAHADQGVRIGEALVRANLVTEAELVAALGRQAGLATVDLARRDVWAEAAELIPESVARDLCVVALADVAGTLEVAAGEYTPDLAATLTGLIRRPVRLLLAPGDEVRARIDGTYRAIAGIDRYIAAYAGTDTRATAETVRSEAIDSEAPVAKVVTMVVTQALRDRASDIHIEPSDDQVRVRFRIDGALTDVLSLPVAMAGPLVSRIKILAGMNIVERRKAQDGQFTTEIDGRSVDVRISTMATVWGEKCVMRVLDKRRSLLRINQLGMPELTYERFGNAVRSPFGMVLCAGPTGSGKTTTLYATLGEMDSVRRNIVTIEDPVEYVFPKINQIQTNEQAGVGFADGLRAILRQDPDVILVGEIRDIDTARTAVQAALTGHFVLSSLHATDSVAALHRFLDMGIEAFLVASSVLGIVSQRLVRRICTGCVEEYKPGEEEMVFFTAAGGDPDRTFVRGAGCNLCAQTGYRDRIGVYEYLTITPEIRRLLVGWATQDELRRMAVSQGMRTLRDEGIALVESDITTVDEIIRSIYAL